MSSARTSLSHSTLAGSVDSRRTASTAVTDITRSSVGRIRSVDGACYSASSSAATQLSVSTTGRRSLASLPPASSAQQRASRQSSLRRQRRPMYKYATGKVNDNGDMVFSDLSTEREEPQNQPQRAERVPRRRTKRYEAALPSMRSNASYEYPSTRSRRTDRGAGVRIFTLASTRRGIDKYAEPAGREVLWRDGESSPAWLLAAKQRASADVPTRYQNTPPPPETLSHTQPAKDARGMYASPRSQLKTMTVAHDAMYRETQTKKLLLQRKVEERIAQSRARASQYKQEMELHGEIVQHRRQLTVARCQKKYFERVGERGKAAPSAPVLYAV